MSTVLSPATLANELKIASGQKLTVTADDLISTGLKKVLYAVATLEDAPVLTVDRAVAFVGDQVSTPPAGSIRIRTYRPTAVADTTPLAASVFSKKVNWLAIGY